MYRINIYSEEEITLWSSILVLKDLKSGTKLNLFVWKDFVIRIGWFTYILIQRRTSVGAIPIFRLTYYISLAFTCNFLAARLLVLFFYLSCCSFKIGLHIVIVDFGLLPVWSSDQDTILNIIDADLPLISWRAYLFYPTIWLQWEYSFSRGIIVHHRYMICPSKSLCLDFSA